MPEYNVVAKRDGDGYMLSYGRGKKKLTVKLNKTGQKFYLDGPEGPLVSITVPGEDPVPNEELTLKVWKAAWGYWAKRVYDLSEEQRHEAIQYKGSVEETHEEAEAEGPAKDPQTREALIELWMFRLDQPVVDDICDAIIAGDIDRATDLAVKHSGGGVSQKKAARFVRAVQEQFDEEVPADKRRDYGSEVITPSDPKDVDALMRHLKERIKTMGFYDVMACLANACVAIGTDRDKAKTPGSDIWYNTAEIVDKVVEEVRNQ